tara:strand:- start:391 stop:513 length:123 start_codon:yes stop_codon:yes gene_type:complete
MSVTYGPAHSDRVDMLADPAIGEPEEPGVGVVVGVVIRNP